MSNFRKYLIFCLLSLTAAVIYAAPRSLEEVDRMPGIVMPQNPDNSDKVTATVADGYIYIAVTEPTNVRIFTILGEMIVQENVAPGVYRYQMKSRGIYLLKAGNYTLRVTL
ncbi:MAG: hypothetical protein K2M94_04050 [Paramuribaculum sp.]|nr:hypothetical protein [Paramuribaculum sp.]